MKLGILQYIQPEGGDGKLKDPENSKHGDKNEDEGNRSTKNDNSLLPVMVWIHGGGFMTGESNLYGPSYLLDRNVILVTLNYRLGPLGFLNLGGNAKDHGHVAHGNQGLWDQREGR